MLGGDIDHVAAAEPLLKSVGTYIVQVGPSGDGQAMKVDYGCRNGHRVRGLSARTTTRP